MNVIVGIVIIFALFGGFLLLMRYTQQPPKKKQYKPDPRYDAEIEENLEKLRKKHKEQAALRFQSPQILETLPPTPKKPPRPRQKTPPKRH